jgi:hypothetical protein
MQPKHVSALINILVKIGLSGSCQELQKVVRFSSNFARFVIYQYDQRKGLRRAGYIARSGELRKVFNILVGNSEGKRPFGRPRDRWEDNIKMNLNYCGRVWTGFMRLRMGSGVKVLWNFGFGW